MADVFFTADTHFNHKNILLFGRGAHFSDVEEMNERLIQNWNAVVGKHDRIYHLGDFSFGPKEGIIEVIERLNGDIHMVRGNHDRQLDSLKQMFASFGDYKEIKVDGQRVCMSHFPFLTWHQAHYGAWMLHGHSHGRLEPTTQPRVDVGVDCWGYSPVSFEELKQTMQGRSYSAVDHHGAEND